MSLDQSQLLQVSTDRPKFSNNTGDLGNSSDGISESRGIYEMFSYRTLRTAKGIWG